MPNRLLRATLVCALSLPPVIHAAQRHEGIARDTRGELVYREVHWRYGDGDATARVVLYRCPDGRAFARKRMRDSPDATAPTFDFVDARTGYREGVRVRGSGREAFWQPRAGAATVGHPLPAGPGLVIDAGFDAYVQANWAAIDARGSSVRFLIPSRGTALRFRVRDAGNTTVLGQPARVLRMGVAGLLGLALPDVELAYHASERRLLRFTGPGTVRDAAGRVQTLRVEFPLRPAEAPQAEVAAALRTPLVTSCER